MNKNGPKQDPWGTPQLILNFSDKVPWMYVHHNPPTIWPYKTLQNFNIQILP